MKVGSYIADGLKVEDPIRESTNYLDPVGRNAVTKTDSEVVIKHLNGKEYRFHLESKITPYTVYETLSSDGKTVEGFINLDKDGKEV